jgi:hypothetical protein
MKSIKDLIDNSVITESKTKISDIKKYAKSWFVQCESYNEYAQTLKTIFAGMVEGLDENIKYYKDQEKADTELFKEDIEDIIEDIKENL